MPYAICHIDSVFYMTYGIWPIGPMAYGFNRLFLPCNLY
jgi:hypothetical protein